MHELPWPVRESVGQERSYVESLYAGIHSLTASIFPERGIVLWIGQAAGESNREIALASSVATRAFCFSRARLAPSVAPSVRSASRASR